MKCKCGHTRKDHCTLGTSHTPYKEEMKQAGGKVKTHPFKCVSNHCLMPMCACLDFKEAK